MKTQFPEVGVASGEWGKRERKMEERERKGDGGKNEIGREKGMEGR